MIDWEDPFDLEALASQIKTDGEDAANAGRARALALLQRRGMMEFEVGEEPDDMDLDQPAATDGED